MELRGVGRTDPSQLHSHFGFADIVSLAQMTSAPPRRPRPALRRRCTALQPCVSRRAALGTLPAAALAFRARARPPRGGAAKERSCVQFRVRRVCERRPAHLHRLRRPDAGRLLYLESAALPAFKRRRPATKASASAWCRSPTCTTSWATSRSAARCACGRREAVVLANRILLPLTKSSTRRRGRCHSSTRSASR